MGSEADAAGQRGPKRARGLDWPELGAALRHDLALREASGESARRSLWATMFSTQQWDVARATTELERSAAAVEVVLVVKLPLPLLLRHDRVVVAVVVEELLALSDGADGPDGGVLAVVVTHDIRVA